MPMPCEKQPQCEQQQREWEFIMEGISTRMTMAMDKIAESNRQMSETNKRLCAALRTMCITMILVVVIVALGFIADHQLSIRDRTNAGGEVVTDAGTGSAQGLPEPGSRAAD